MPVLHVLLTPGFIQYQLKVINYKFCTMAPFLIYADFESILEPLDRQAKQTTYLQHHKVCVAVAILCSNLGKYNQLTVTKFRENALTEFQGVLLEWETAISEKLRTNRQIKRMCAQKQESFENETKYYICRHTFVEDDPKGPKVGDHGNITGFFLSAAH